MQHCCGKRYCFAFVSVIKFPWYFDASVKDRKRQDLGLKTCFKYMPNGKEPSAKCFLAFVEVKITQVVYSHSEVLCEKGVLNNVAKFTGKYLYRSLFFNKVAGLGLQLY